MAYPSTLVAAVKYFSNEQICIDAVAEMKWPDGQISCSGCGEIGNTIWLANQKRWKCRGCKKQFSVKVGTIFHDSPLGLDKWMVAMWMLANCRNGVSSYEIARTIGVTQKSAWHMLHRIREAMTDDSYTIGEDAPVEMDETFVGGKAKNMTAKNRARKISGPNKGKTIVVGMLERGGKVKAKVVFERNKETLLGLAHSEIAAGSTVITDELHAYKGMNHTHEVVNHAVEYVNGHIHTNGIENFWAGLKRSLGGTYISVEPFHLDAYVAEQVFRFNLRHGIPDAARFKAVLKDVVGRRLTYARLTGREASAAF